MAFAIAALRRSAAGLACSAALLPAAASIKTFDYTAVGHGATVVGSFGWDTATPDARTDSPDFGLYPGSGFDSVRVTGGPMDGLVNSRTDLTWQVWNTGVDLLSIYFDASRVDLIDQDGTAWDSDALPASLDLSAFETRNLVVLARDLQLTYEITSLTLRTVDAGSVPEPAPLVLLPPALLAAGAARLRPRSSSRSAGHAAGVVPLA